ncbi:hypothetical protein VPNG_08321 [Cytospora leucostoma]|uniref:Uncharacterized protein n=1 Tax=Cytospora leucostoma TaxID=1230097 RepID=A0A423W9M1_9PEZI|nr:hypothetical protein VPNG_08321 [Cytospora leucostoma]
MAGMTIFEDALARFKSRLNASELRQFGNLTTLNELKATILSIQKAQEDKKETKNLPRIQRFLEGMEQLGKIVDIFLNSSEILAFVWGPMKFLLLTASVWADAFEILLDAYESIGKHFPLLNDFEGLFYGNDDVRQVLGLIYEDILKFHSAALQFFSRPLWRQLLKSTWKDFDATFKRLLSSLNHHNDFLNKLASAQHMKQLNTFISNYAVDADNIREHIDQYINDRKDRLLEAERTETERKWDHKQKVLQWLAATTMSGLHEKFFNVRKSCPGSGDWVLKSEKLKDWKAPNTPNNSILWLYGIPGAGKTILASKIVDDCTETPEFKTTYFYCRYGDNTTTSCNGILKGLIAQMINHCDELVPFCQERMKATADSTLTTEALAKQILEVSFKRIPKQFIIIDGLDECDPTQRGNLLRILTALVKVCDEQSNYGKPRVLLTSRNLGDIQNSLAEATWMEIQRDDNREDLEVFLRLKMERLIQKFDLSQEPALTDELMKRTLVYASGMFLYAELVMRNLEDCYDRKTFREEISNSVFPTGIEQAYGRILHRMKVNLNDPGERKWQRTRRLLGWIVAAKRPLKIYELQAVLSIDGTEKRMDYEEKRLRVHITEYCGSLVQMVGDDRVELVHHTARE